MGGDAVEIGGAEDPPAQPASAKTQIAAAKERLIVYPPEETAHS
jgi:hypothetical protein